MVTSTRILREKLLEITTEYLFNIIEYKTKLFQAHQTLLSCYMRTVFRVVYLQQNSQGMLMPTGMVFIQEDNFYAI